MAQANKSIIFKAVTKHGTHRFTPGVALGFADDRAEEYFVKAGWADWSDQEPVDVYPAGSVEIDPETRDHATGALVLGS